MSFFVKVRVANVGRSSIELGFRKGPELYQQRSLAPRNGIDDYVLNCGLLIEHPRSKPRGIQNVAIDLPAQRIRVNLAKNRPEPRHSSK